MGTVIGVILLIFCYQVYLEKSDRSHCNLKQLALAMYSYQDKNGSLPPAVVFGKYGQPLYSWRVLLLPYIEQEDLYKKFKLDEPWDSQNNIRLLPYMPKVYGPPPGKKRIIPPFYSICKVFFGEGAAFEGNKGKKIPNDFPNGPEKTILIIEGGIPVPWTKPEEIIFDKKLPEITSPLFPDGFRVAFADGHVEFINRKTLNKSEIFPLILRGPYLEK